MRQLRNPAIVDPSEGVQQRGFARNDAVAAATGVEDANFNRALVVSGFFVKRATKISPHKKVVGGTWKDFTNLGICSLVSESRSDGQIVARKMPTFRLAN